ncbi:hypothetical protein Tco_1516000 [Tanacetum coccineum]
MESGVKWPIEEELRNPELEKELEKRLRRRGEGSSDKDKYHDDIKEGDDRRLSTRSDRSKDERHKMKNNGTRKEKRESQDDDRDYRHKEEKHQDVRHRDDTDREKRARDSKYTSRDHPVEPETKRLRDDSGSGDLYHRKTSNRGGLGSPFCDDRHERASILNHKKRPDAKVDSVSERGRPGSRYADMETTASHSRRRSSPGGSSYPARDHYRGSKQEETKYRDYAYDDRARHNVHSSRDYTSAPGLSDKLSSKSSEKVAPKDDNYMGDLSGERRLRPDSRSSPLVDKSPSSTSNERRNLNRSDARRSLDLEDSGPRNGGPKEHSVKDGKGSRELVSEPHPDNDFSQIDNDNISVSSPYTRNSHFSEDDRSKSNNRHRRMVDPNMNRAQGNWKNVPNWPSPMATGGYIPFQHVAPPMFHPLMQQFPPPMFGRPPMKLNPGLPYNVPDHGRPLAWRNQVDESVPPPMHGWDPNNAVFGDESHLYGRPDWDRRTQLNNRGWDQSGDMWKGQNAGASMDMQSGPQKDGYSAQRATDEMWPGQVGLPDESEPNQMDIQAETTLDLDKKASLAQMVIESPQILEVVKQDYSALISKAYLSRIDVSEDLTQPELYDQYTSMMDLDQEPDVFECKILFLEDDANDNEIDNASLFTAVDDSVFQKAMFLYKKQKEEFRSTNMEKISSPITNGPEFVSPSDVEKGGLDADSKPVEEGAAEVTVMETSIEKDEPNKLEEVMAMEVDHVIVKQEEEPELNVEEKTSAPLAGGLLPYKVKEVDESTNDGGGDSSLVLPDVPTTGVAMIESIEFGYYFWLGLVSQTFSGVVNGDILSGEYYK